MHADARLQGPRGYRHSIAPSSRAGHHESMDLNTTSATATAVTDQPMIVNCIAYHQDGRRIGDITLDAISDTLARPDTFVWVGLHEPDEVLLEKLQEEFGLHDLAIEDAHNAHQRTKIETYGDSLFLVVQTAQLVEGHLAFGETHIFGSSRESGKDRVDE